MADTNGAAATPETFEIPDPSGKGTLTLSRERLVELAKAGAAQGLAREQISAMAERNRRREAELEELEGLQKLLDRDPAKAVQVVAALARDKTGGALGLTSEELGLIDDDDSEDGASGAVSRALTRRLESLEREQREAKQSSAQQRQESEVRAALDDYPDIKGSEAGKRIFTTVVRAIGASGSQAEIRDIAETVALNMRHFLQEAAEVKLKERERNARDYAMPGGGAPTLTAPEKPFTAQDFKQGGVKAHALEIFEKMKLAAQGGGSV